MTMKGPQKESARIAPGIGKRKKQPRTTLLILLGILQKTRSERTKRFVILQMIFIE